MSYSKLTNKYMPSYSGNYTKGREQKVQKVTIHHTGSVMNLEQLGKLWQTVGRRGSSHYGVKDKQVYCYVQEENTAWCDGNWNSNSKSITIETCNSKGSPNWEVSDESLETLIKLIVDIFKRYGWEKAEIGKNITYHSMYSSTVCPGPYLKSKMQYIEDEVNKRLFHVEQLEQEEPEVLEVSDIILIKELSSGDKKSINNFLKEKQLTYIWR